MRKELNSIATVWLAIGLSACASDTLNLSAATMVAPAAFATESDGTVLIVKRDTGGALGLRACRYTLFLDGREFSVIGYGEAVQAFPPAGPHILSMKNSPGLCNSGDVEVAIQLARGSKSTFRITTDPTGKAILQPTAF